MKTLIVEDDFIARCFLKDVLSPYGQCDIAINGQEAIMAFGLAHGSGAPYDLICMDVMMPEMDGQEALKIIRQMESERGIKGSNEVKVIMTTALSDPANVVEAYYQGGATAYLVKPIDHRKLLAEVQLLGLITQG